MESLSIVFQGSVWREGAFCPEVRKHIQCTQQIFPAAEIIVSSWKSNSIADAALQRELEAMNCRVVLNDDPGVLVARDKAGEYRNNVNRLLCSAYAGLQAATRPLAIKLRTDTRLYGRGVENLLQRYVLQGEGPARHTAFQIFESRLINASWFARDAHGSLPFLYHPGDILLAGRIEDMRLFFSAPFAGQDLFHPASMPGLWVSWRYVPEQWLWVHAIKKVTGRIVYKGGLQFTVRDRESSDRYFLNNFVPFRPYQLQLWWPKYWRRYPLRGLFSTMNYRRWMRLNRWYSQGKAGKPYGLLEHSLSALWRGGYILRTALLQQPAIRRIAIRIFSHHR